MLFRSEESSLRGDRPAGNTDYELIKAILDEFLPGKVVFARHPPTPHTRAVDEFDREFAALRAATAIALDGGKTRHLETRFEHMQWLIDTFHLETELGETRANVKQFSLIRPYC